MATVFYGYASIHESIDHGKTPGLPVWWWRKYVAVGDEQREVIIHGEIDQLTGQRIELIYLDQVLIGPGTEDWALAPALPEKNPPSILFPSCAFGYGVGVRCLCDWLVRFGISFMADLPLVLGPARCGISS